MSYTSSIVLVILVAVVAESLLGRRDEGMDEWDFMSSWESLLGVFILVWWLVEINLLTEAYSSFQSITAGLLGQ